MKLNQPIDEVYKGISSSEGAVLWYGLYFEDAYVRKHYVAALFRGAAPSSVFATAWGVGVFDPRRGQTRKDNNSYSVSSGWNLWRKKVSEKVRGGYRTHRHLWVPGTFPVKDARTGIALLIARVEEGGVGGYTHDPDDDAIRKAFARVFGDRNGPETTAG